uniref:LOB domain-containing protein n=1 Tax=Fagus sylvatica TaxID=28930 RepID=A0A2N9ILL6_FAGSY
MGFQVLGQGSSCRTHQPCAACRMLRRKCESDCLLAPYFPGDQVEKFAGVHRVFGASNVIKMIQMVEETRREDAVKALVYEARARLKDPVYGSTGAIFHLQKMVQELKVQLESIRARVRESQTQRDELLGILRNVNHLDLVPPINDTVFDGDSFMLENDVLMAYDPVKFPAECDWFI